MERKKISKPALAHEEQRIRNYAKQHGLRILEFGKGVICRGRNKSYHGCYAKALKDTQGDKNARRHGYPLRVEVIISILTNGRVSCLPVYARQVKIVKL